MDWTMGASLFHGTERNGTDQFRVLFDGTEQRWNGKISDLVCACTLILWVPPVEPKAGEFYLSQGLRERY